jgi:hypothetical protein
VSEVRHAPYVHDRYRSGHRACWWWCAMSGGDRVIRWSTALAVLGVAAVAAVASYEHAYDLVRAHGEAGWTARLVPLTLDGLRVVRRSSCVKSGALDPRDPRSVPRRPATCTTLQEYLSAKARRKGEDLRITGRSAPSVEPYPGGEDVPISVIAEFRLRQ